MDSWKSLVLAVAFLGYISVTTAQITATYQCVPLAAGTGNIGQFVVTINENDAITLSNYVYLLTDLTTCGTGALVAASPGVKTLTAAVAINQDTTSGGTALPCGVTPGSTAGSFVLNFATKSLTAADGYSTTNDKRFEITCDSLATVAVALSDTRGFPISGVLANPDATNPLPPGVTMRIEYKLTDAADSTFAPVPVGSSGTTALSPTDKIRVIVELDPALASECKIFMCAKWPLVGPEECLRELCTETLARLPSQSFQSPTLADTPLLGHRCPTLDAVVLGVGATTGFFTYGPDPDDNSKTLGTSETFEIFTLYRTADTAGVTQVMVGVANVIACAEGCAQTEVCTGRKKRSADEGKKVVDESEGSLYAPIMFTIDPQAAAQARAAAAAAAVAAAARTSDSACEPMSNMGYLIGMIVLAALLVFSVAVTVFMFSRMNRPRTEYPKA